MKFLSFLLGCQDAEKVFKIKRFMFHQLRTHMFVFLSCSWTKSFCTGMLIIWIKVMKTFSHFTGDSNDIILSMKWHDTMSEWSSVLHNCCWLTRIFRLSEVPSLWIMHTLTKLVVYLMTNESLNTPGHQSSGHKLNGSKSDSLHLFSLGWHHLDNKQQVQTF